MGLLNTVSSSLTNTIEGTARVTDRVINTVDNIARIAEQTSEVGLAGNTAWCHDIVNDYDEDTQAVVRAAMPELKFLPAEKPKQRAPRKK